MWTQLHTRVFKISAHSLQLSIVAVCIYICVYDIFQLLTKLSGVKKNYQRRSRGKKETRWWRRWQRQRQQRRHRTLCVLAGISCMLCGCEKFFANAFIGTKRRWFYVISLFVFRFKPFAYAYTNLHGDCVYAFVYHSHGWCIRYKGIRIHVLWSYIFKSELIRIRACQRFSYFHEKCGVICNIINSLNNNQLSIVKWWNKMFHNR